MKSGGSTPTRVLHVGKFFPPHRGGMETYLADLVAAQRRANCDARVLVHGHPQPDDPDWLHRVPVQFQVSFAPIALGFAWTLHRLIDTFRPNVLHVHMPNNAVLWALVVPAARRVPWVVHWHSDILTERMSVGVRQLFKLYAFFESRVLDKADCIVATSPPYLDASQTLAAFRHKCTVVPLGLAELRRDDSVVQPQLPWRAGLRLLSIGRMTYYKNFSTLVQAVAGQPGLELALVGDGELLSDLKIQAQQLCGAQASNIHFLGNVSDAEKHALLATCDVFCLPSNERTEAFGMVLLEAFRQAKPCVVSQLHGSGMPWLVESTGAGWAHLRGDDPVAWQQCLQSLCQQGCELARRGKLGQQAYRARFTSQSNATALQMVYDAVAPQSHVPADADHPNKRTTLIVIPAKDESVTLPTVLADLKAHGWPHVLVIDDLSSDGTGELARQHGAMVARPVLPLGAWGGMQLGIRWAHAFGFARVITMDADGQHEVDELPALLAAASHADTVIGAFPERASLLRRFAWRWFQWLTGLKVTDLTSGFRCYNHKAISVLASEAATQLDYQDVGTLLLLRRAGLTVSEVPVSMNSRVAGASRIFRSWVSVARYMAVTTVLCATK